MSVEIFRKMIEILEIDANILLGKEAGDTEKQESFQEVLYRIQKMEWKEQKIIMQTIDSLIDSFNEYNGGKFHQYYRGCKNEKNSPIYG